MVIIHPRMDKDLLFGYHQSGVLLYLFEDLAIATLSKLRDVFEARTYTVELILQHRLCN